MNNKINDKMNEGINDVINDKINEGINEVINDKVALQPLPPVVIKEGRGKN